MSIKNIIRHIEERHEMKQLIRAERDIQAIKEKLDKAIEQHQSKSVVRRLIAEYKRRAKIEHDQAMKALKKSSLDAYLKKAGLKLEDLN